VTADWLSLTHLPQLFHQHEMLFGFSSAIVFGFILTALPSWAGTVEINGARLQWLVLSWLTGRLAVAASTLLPLPLVAALDLGFPVLFILLVAPGLRTVHRRFKLGLAPIVGGYLAGNVCYYLGVLEYDQAMWLQGLRLGLYALIFHCSVTVGVLAPIFTENALRETGRPRSIGHHLPLEWLSALSILALALADTASASPTVCGGLALLSCLLHGVRLGRWRSLMILATPIVWVLHAGYAWLVIALALYACQAFGLSVGTQSWVHAFTVGGFGLMSLGLMTRVSLRHTGRNIHPAPAMVAGFLCLGIAALARVALAYTGLSPLLLILSALLWLVPYLLYLILFARILFAPSLNNHASA
jgi:uncharacterized protein involved in response to NO